MNNRHHSIRFFLLSFGALLFPACIAFVYIDEPANTLYAHLCNATWWYMTPFGKLYLTLWGIVMGAFAARNFRRRQPECSFMRRAFMMLLEIIFYIMIAFALFFYPYGVCYECCSVG